MLQKGEERINSRIVKKSCGVVCNCHVLTCNLDLNELFNIQQNTTLQSNLLIQTYFVLTVRNNFWERIMKRETNKAGRLGSRQVVKTCRDTETESYQVDWHRKKQVDIETGREVETD